MHARNGFAPLQSNGYPDEEHAAALRARTSNRTGMLLSAQELVGLVHVPGDSVRNPAFTRMYLAHSLESDPAR